MYTIETNIELPIAHCLYRGAYSGLCCGNVYRDMTDDGVKERYCLNNNVLPCLHGHNYFVTITLTSNQLDGNKMVIDFKEFKKIIHKELDQYDHSMILTEDNPLVKIYRDNYKENNIDFNRSRIFVWDENPTAEYMSYKWHNDILKRLEERGLKVDKLAITVEETSHNEVTYEE